MAASKTSTKAVPTTGSIFDNTFVIEKITVDKDFQARAMMNQDAIGDYRDIIFEGEKELPPMELVTDGETFWLVDGFHRYQAYKKLGIVQVPVNITKGTRRDALIAAIGANQSHGLRRSNADKRQAVKMAFNLMQSEDENWTDQRIADLTGVSAMFVGNVRKEDYSGTYAQTRTGTGGRSVTRQAQTFEPSAAPASMIPIVAEQDTEEKEAKEPKAPEKLGTIEEHTKFPLGIALDKFSNRMSAAEQALAEVFKIFPDDETLAKAISTFPALVTLWQRLRDSATAIAKAVNDVGGDA